MNALERLTGFLGLPLHPSEIGRFRTRELAVQAAARDGFAAALVEEGEHGGADERRWCSEDAIRRVPQIPYILWWGLRDDSSGWLRWTHLSKTWAAVKAGSR